MAWIRITSVEDIPLYSMKQFVLDEDEIAVYHINEGFFATSDICTHASQRLTEGTLNGAIVACPKHGGKFNVMTGQATAFPCVIPLATYNIDIRDNDIWLDYD